MVFFQWVLMVHRLYEVPHLQAKQVARDLPGLLELHRQETPLETALKGFRLEDPHP